MKNLLFAAFLLLLSLNSCKKDRYNAGTLRRPVSVTTTGPVVNQKMELEYEGFETLKELSYFNNDQLVGKVVYQNQNGLPASAMIYGSLTGQPDQAVAEVTFTYDNRKLLKVALQSKVNFVIDATTHQLNYSGHENNSYHTYLLGMISDYAATGGLITSSPNNPVMSKGSTSNSVNVLTYTYEFDSKINPFYDLPVICAIIGNNAMSSLARPIFVFEGANFFHKNNALVRKMDIGSGTTINVKMEYTYNSQGYPTKVKTYTADGTSVYSETVIKY